MAYGSFECDHTLPFLLPLRARMAGEKCGISMNAILQVQQQVPLIPFQYITPGLSSTT